MLKLPDLAIGSFFIGSGGETSGIIKRRKVDMGHSNPTNGYLEDMG
jgi:hypothetical protein